MTIFSPQVETEALVTELKDKLSKAKKADIPGIVEDMGIKFMDLCSCYVEGDAVSISMSGSIKDSTGQITDLPEVLEDYGKATTNTARREVSMSRTHNLGNYESATYRVTVETHTEDTAEGAKKGLEICEAITTEKIKSYSTQIGDYIKKKADKKAGKA